MSEFQYVAFQAVDRPLDNNEIEFAEQQSSRAEITRWTFSCTYDYSSFRGDVDGLLRNGYDVFLNYTNYGDREIRLRLPQGLPFPKKIWSNYIDGESLVWKKDSKGPGGILALHPFYEPGDIDEVWEFDDYLNAAIDVRHRLLFADLRGLYLLWLCSIAFCPGEENDEAVNVTEPPVPHGMCDLYDSAGDLLLFYGLDPMMLRAASIDVDAAPTIKPIQESVRQWANTIKPDKLRRLVSDLLVGDTAKSKATLLAEVRDSKESIHWPTTEKKRTFSHLLNEADRLRSKANAEQARLALAKAKRKAEKAERDRQARMKKMGKSPKKWLKEADDLVKARGRDNYQTAVDILFDLRESLGSNGDKIVLSHAAHLVKKHPTLTQFKGMLRKKGLID